MNTFAVTSRLDARRTPYRRTAIARLDDDAKIFLVGQLAVAGMAILMCGASWLLATRYDIAWAWPAKMLAVVAAWPLYLIVRAWAFRLL